MLSSLIIIYRSAQSTNMENFMFVRMQNPHKTDKQTAFTSENKYHSEKPGKIRSHSPEVHEFFGCFVIRTASCITFCWQSFNGFLKTVIFALFWDNRTT